MAIITSQTEVGTAAVKLVDVDNVVRYVRLHVSGNGTFIGSNGVTSTTGLKVDNGDKFDLSINEGEQLWAITSAGTSTVYVFVSKID